ncbi:MAG: sulfatase-like hydrolase/transferase, partial [Anaerolineales bacterium]|nr:sulfatase-like hydrolase/transferase [Anaerolineales bacterium]
SLRKKAVRWAAVGCILAGVSIAATAIPKNAAAAAQKGDKPNVVLMMSDNIGYGDIGAFQGGAIRGMPTPNIDRLASAGLTLTQFLVEPACTPTRAGLLTGRYSPRAGLGTIIIGGTPNTLQDKEVTLGELFKSVGYATAYTGKWHLGKDKQSWPTSQGFDEYRVGVIETSDSTLYRPQMELEGMPEELIKKTAPGIWDGDSKNGIKQIAEYTVEYKRIVEEDIATASSKYINDHAKGKEPFFILIGWTQTHYPNALSEKFDKKSSVGPYGDAMLQHDYCVGQVLETIEKAGIEDNTIVIYMSDNGATPLSGPQEFRGGSNGNFVGELGDGREGSIRTPGMIKWPGKIPVRKSNEMVSVHDFFPTLATIIGAKIPTDRAIDGVDQSAFFLGKQDKSNRESLLTFIGDEIVAVRWKQFRVYPKLFINSPDIMQGRGLIGNRLEGNGMPQTFNIEKDPREQANMGAKAGWIIPQYMRIIGEYKKSLVKYPNPPAVSITEFKK